MLGFCSAACAYAWLHPDARFGRSPTLEAGTTSGGRGAARVSWAVHGEARGGPPTLWLGAAPTRGRHDFRRAGRSAGLLSGPSAKARAARAAEWAPAS